MKLEDAAKILNLSDDINSGIVKAAYRRASSQYHPDKGGSVEMMQAVNQAYEVLKNHEGKVDGGKDNYSEALNDAINAVINLQGINIEICGAWVWVTGDTKPHAKVLGKNGAGFFFASKKKAWYFRPSDWKSTSRGNFTLDEIRDNHGSQTVRGRGRRQLAEA